MENKYSKDFAEMVKQAKEKINNAYNDALKSYPNDRQQMAQKMADNLQIKDAKNVAPLIYEKENGKSIYTDSFSRAMATTQFHNKYKNEYNAASNGSTRINSELQEFSSEQRDFCKTMEDNCQKRLDYLDKQNSNDKNIQKDKALLANSKNLYGKQRNLWDEGSKRVRTNDNNQNQKQNLSQNNDYNKSYSEQKSQSNAQQTNQASRSRGR